MKKLMTMRSGEVELLDEVLSFVLYTQFENFEKLCLDAGHTFESRSELQCRDTLIFQLDDTLKRHPYYKALTLKAEMEAAEYDIG